MGLRMQVLGAARLISNLGPLLITLAKVLKLSVFMFPIGRLGH